MADIISTLPDAILCHILSFLQTKQSFAASILSKRWNHLWLSVPTLCFQQIITDRITGFEFKDFVYSVLIPRDVVKTFHLDVTYSVFIRCPTNTITKWINFVLQRRLEYLYLRIKLAAQLSKLPITTLTCKTLVVLKLSGFEVKEGFSDSSVVLPSLKTLHLEHIWFPKLQEFTMFLSRCPILQDLRTFHVSFGSNESLTCIEWKSFFLRNLTRADIYYSPPYYFPWKAVANTPSLRLELNPVHYRKGSIDTFLNLTQLELISLDYIWWFLVELLNHCPKLQKLHIDQAEVDKEMWTGRDDGEKWVDPDVVPQCLSLHLTTCNLFNFLGLQGELQLARYILMKAKVLQTMQIRNVGRTGIRRLISSCPKASTACKVTIC